jgi:uracil-DNA glycosylase
MPSSSIPLTHTPLPPFSATIGDASTRPRIVLLGEAWGESEESHRAPFVGSSGKELFRMLGEATGVAPELHASICARFRYGDAWIRVRQEWFDAAGIAATNVLALRPPGNVLEALCVAKDELPAGYGLPAITKAHYLAPVLLSELERLSAELRSWQPNIIIALGATASWALLHATNIGSIRGTTASAIAIAPGAKVLPTYHPAAVLRQWQWRTIVLADLMKAWSESEYSEIRRPERSVLVNPTLEELQRWCAATLAQARQRAPLVLSCDIETEFRQVNCVGFAGAINSAIVIPFIDKSRPGWSYWSSAHEERGAWDCIAALLSDPNIEVLGQNFMYDMQYLNPLGLSIARVRHDTMLLHHSMYPELQKGLGFLGSIYTSESSWKLMRRAKADTEKRDE